MLAALRQTHTGLIPDARIAGPRERDGGANRD
jgi:hypothetical protein